MRGRKDDMRRDYTAYQSGDKSISGDREARESVYGKAAKAKSRRSE